MVARFEETRHMGIPTLLGQEVGDLIGDVGTKKAGNTGCVVERRKGAVSYRSSRGSPQCRTSIVLDVVSAIPISHTPSCATDLSATTYRNMEKFQTGGW